ncbi:hypothetical protein A3E49_01825 [Candidatus Saccharibacteria bacterium RIFCSPHIGHO2_12_FULL_49_19]|nr:MAG: hypothetical protein A3E49_01825 [Candidatus Saccharibacteria bacterium RIFCSPHIGHO2_12_FULL_49_19]
MGRVFSYSAIEAGKVPQPHDFKQAAVLFAELAEGGIRSGAIDGSFIYGSVALGVANYRSDFDALLSLNSQRPSSYSAARVITQQLLLETEHTIPVLPIVQTKNALKDGNHEMDRFFGQHLMGDYRIVQGNDPAGYMEFANHPAGEILSSYLFQKKRRLANSYAIADPLDVNEGGIQRMLELPQAVGRKLLQAVIEADHVLEVPETLQRTAEKSMVLGETRKLLRDNGIGEGFEGLVVANDEYDVLLEETIKGGVDEETYHDVIRGFHANLPRAITWIEQVEQSFLPLFR